MAILVVPFGKRNWPLWIVGGSIVASALTAAPHIGGRHGGSKSTAGAAPVTVNRAPYVPATRPVVPVPVPAPEELSFEAPNTGLTADGLPGLAIETTTIVEVHRHAVVSDDDKAAIACVADLQGRIPHDRGLAAVSTVDELMEFATDEYVKCNAVAVTLLDARFTIAMSPETRQCETGLLNAQPEASRVMLREWFRNSVIASGVFRHGATYLRETDVQLRSAMLACLTAEERSAFGEYVSLTNPLATPEADGLAPIDVKRDLGPTPKF